MMKQFLHIALILTPVFIMQPVFSQQGNNWYFGDHAALSFSTIPPTPLYNSAMLALEGCGSISDTSGNLLFYTNGVEVYNRNHQQMPNGFGLFGHSSASQAAIIVPMPGDDSKYYIFTSDAEENQQLNGYCYSVVDMSLDAGLGDVTTKNVLLYARSSEKMTVVKHANATDAWIVTKDYDSTIFRSFHISCNGVNPVPVISYVGVPINHTRIGSLKSSPDGTKIGTAQYIKGWELYDFDKNTGVLSNAIYIRMQHIPANFGLEFSPDSRLVYIASEFGSNHNGGEIYQFNISIPDSLSITNSKYLVYYSVGLANGNMQTGPDGKIYIPNENDSSLSVINDPNQQGPACDFSFKAINLGFNRLAIRGLPNVFPEVNNSSVVDFSAVASADCRTISFTGISSLPGPLTWYWDFGDNTFGSGQFVNHIYATTGTYKVKLSVVNTGICGANGSHTRLLEMYPIAPIAKFGFSQQCPSKTVNFIDSSFIAPGYPAKWFWDFGDGSYAVHRNPQHSYSQVGQYQVKLIVTTPGVCGKKDSSIVTLHISPEFLSLGADVTICSGDSIILKEPTGFYNYTWQDGSTDSLFTVTQTGLYYINVTDYCNINYTDSIYVTVNIPRRIQLGNDTSICSNADLLLNAGAGFAGYLWNTGNISQLQPVDSARQYTVTATNNFGCISKDTINILHIFAAPSLTLNKTTVFCLNQHNTINAGSGYNSYLWQNGYTSSTITVTQPGWYKLRVGNQNLCYAYDSVLVLRVTQPPSGFLPGDSSICSDENIILRPDKDFKTYLWSDGSLASNIVVSPGQKIWLYVVDFDNCTGADTIQIFSKDCSTRFYIPNAFTPDKNGLNDYFKPAISGRIESYEFNVYNMYGQLVFSSNRLTTGWDGTYRTRPQSNGAYVWICRYKAKYEEARVSKGTVLLLR